MNNQKTCEEHKVIFPNPKGLWHHIREIHYGYSIDEIEKKMWSK